MDFCLLLTLGTSTTNPSNCQGCPEICEVGSEPLETSALGSLARVVTEQLCLCSVGEAMWGG